MPWSAWQRRQWEHWLLDKPEAVEELARRCPPDTCYRDRSRVGHFKVESYAFDDDTGEASLRLIHGADSFSPGVIVDGAQAEYVVPCGCEKWEPPSEEQAAAAIQLERAARGGMTVQ